MPRRSEKSIVESIKRAFNGLDRCFVRKRRPYIKGDPDLTGAYHGIRIEIEVKTPRGVISPLQKKRIRDYKNLGVLAGVAWSLKEAVELIWPILLKKDKKTLEKHLE